MQLGFREERQGGGLVHLKWGWQGIAKLGLEERVTIIQMEERRESIPKRMRKRGTQAQRWEWAWQMWEAARRVIRT